MRPPDRVFRLISAVPDTGITVTTVGSELHTARACMSIFAPSVAILAALRSIRYALPQLTYVTARIVVTSPVPTAAV